MGLELLPRLADVDALLLVDALRTGGQPGTLTRLEGDGIQSALAVKMSAHQVGLQELLAVSALLDTRPPHIVLLGLEPAAVEWGLDLSPPVAAGIEPLVAAMVTELRLWGAAAERSSPQSAVNGSY